MTDNFDDLRDPSSQGDQGNTGGSEDPFAFDDLSSLDEPSFPDPGTEADLPDELGPAEPTDRSRTFIIGLFALVALLVIGLILILFAAAEIGRQNEVRRQTAAAIEQTNQYVLTAVAATATAKSWTLTPSNTPLPTFTPTFTPSLTNTPTATYTDTVTVTTSVTASPSLSPTFTPTQSLTPLPTREGIQGTADAYSTFAAQIAAGVNAASAQETENAIIKGAPTVERAQSTQNAQFYAYQTFAVSQLTAIPMTITALFSTPSANVASTLPPVMSPTATSPSSAPTAEGTALGSNHDPRAVVNMEPAKPVRRQGPDLTATAAPLLTESAQLDAASTANAIQLTLNAIYGTPPAVYTQNAQIYAGGTAIAIQLTINARLLGGLVTPEATATSHVPNTGLFDDLSAGASPSVLILLVAAAASLVGVIVVARKLRVRE